ncbi:MAG: hypothetical protein ACR2IK_08465 [Chloroflexota bacterium]
MPSAEEALARGRDAPLHLFEVSADIRRHVFALDDRKVSNSVRKQAASTTERFGLANQSAATFSLGSGRFTTVGAGSQDSGVQRQTTLSRCRAALLGWLASSLARRESDVDAAHVRFAIPRSAEPVRRRRALSAR